MPGTFPGLTLVLISLMGLLHPAGVAAQTAVVEQEENFRAEPNGIVLGRLAPGTPLTVEGRQGGWVRATLEGYVWTRSMQLLPDGELDLVISAAEGENLRDEPQGRLMGRLDRGAQLEELERVPGWVRVRRTGWIWASSVSLPEGVQVPVAREADAAPEPARDTQPAATPSDPGGDGPWLTVGPPGKELLDFPDGRRLGAVDPGSDVRVVTRDGGWARVRMEGWIWLPQEEDGDDDPVGEVPRVTPGELGADPEGFRGRRVEMELQFISLERAQAIRTDFYQGEPFVLTRTRTGDRAFVYVAVPPDRLDEVEGLAPLEALRVVGRVRTGASEYTGNPVLELIELARVR